MACCIGQHTADDILRGLNLQVACGSPTGRLLPVPPDHPESLVAVDLVAPAGVVAQLVEVDRPNVGRQTSPLHPRSHAALRRGLLGVEARDGDQLAQKRDQAVKVECTEGATLGAESASRSLPAHAAPLIPGRAGPAA